MPLRRLARHLPAPVRRALRAVRGRASGAAPTPVVPVRSAATTRVLTLSLAPPPPPGGGRQGESVDPGAVVVRAPLSMYVPRMLEERGLGGYERYGLDCFLAMVELAPPGAVFDIGANIGIYGHLAAAYTDRDVHLFEPTPEAARVADSATLRPGGRCTVVQAAVGAEEGTARLYISDRTDSSNSLNASFRPHSSHVDVPLIRLDDYVHRTGAIPAVVKIDTETTEPDVLAGAADLLTTHRPWLMVEVLAGRVEDRLEAALAPYGYVGYHLAGPGALEPAARIVGDPTYEHLMYLFLPEPAVPLLWERMAAWRDVLDAGTVDVDVV